MAEDLLKVAELAIIQLRDENVQLREETEVIKTAERLAFNMFKTGSLAAENLQGAINDFSAKSIDELRIMEKAIEFNKTASIYSFGRISDSAQDDGSLDPITRMLLADFN